MNNKQSNRYPVFFKYFFAIQSLFKIIPVLCLLLCTINLSAFSGHNHSTEGGAKAKVWVGTWGTGLQAVEARNMPPAPGLSNNTLRQVVCVSIGGKRLRLKFSNQFGKSPVIMKAVQIAVSTGGSGIDPATAKTLAFNGRQDVTMEAGAEIAADPVAFDLKPRMQVAITISYGETSAIMTGHPGSFTTSYLLAGEHAAPNADFKEALMTQHWYSIKGIDVETSKSVGAVVVFGDSITDGNGSGTNEQNRWPDVLEIALLENNVTKQVGVLNMGIGGNCVLRAGFGPSGLDRFDREVIQQSGVRWLVIFEGINDLGATRDSTSAAEVAKNLIAAYDKMIIQAHAQGIKVYGATITPVKRSFYYTSYKDAARNAVNKWIRTSGHFDAVIDFDKAIRDPNDEAAILPANQSGDYLHPSKLGYRVMGGSVDLSLFK
ncbi:lysophospholipase L1-like esterase [Mucilaginibacter sp. HD30]